MKELLGEKLYTYTEVAELLGVTPTTLRNYVKKGLLQNITISGRKYVNEDILRAFLRNSLSK